MNQTELEKKELFENTPVAKALMTLSIPTIISQLIHLIYSLADTFFVGRTGNPYMIAGVSLAFNLFILGIPIANLFGLGGGSQIARMMGWGQNEEARTVSSYCFWMTIAVSVSFSVIVFAFMEPILNFLGASEQTMPYCRQYTTLVVVLGTLPTCLSSVIAHLLRNTGFSKQASMGLSGGGVLNIILDPLCMFVIFPKGMEVFAAAFATLVSNVIACIYLIAVFLRCCSRAPLSLAPSKLREIKKPHVKQVYSVGVPSAILPGLMDVANFVLFGLMSSHGDLQLAAIGIVTKAERLPNAINLGISQGMLPLVAYNYASGNRERMQNVIKTARRIGLGTAVCCIALYQLLAKPLCGVFLDTSVAEEAALTLGFAVLFLRIRCLASPMQFMNYYSSYCMQAVGNGKSTLLHACVRVLGGYIPFMYIGNAVFGQIGLVSAFPIGETFGAIVAAIIVSRLFSNTLGEIRDE